MLATQLAQNKARDEAKRVIVRAYRDEPVRMLEIGRSDAGVELVTRIGGLSIVFPDGYVYSYSDATFAVLREAFDSGDRNALLSRWMEAASNEETE